MREIVRVWLSTDLTEDRHRRRVAKIDALKDLTALSARNRWRLGSGRGLERYARVNGQPEPAAVGGAR